MKAQLDLAAEVTSGRSEPVLDRFRQLQAQFRDRWSSAERFDSSDADIVVIPSLSLDQRELLKIEGFHHYEERLLFSLIRLWNPRTRLVYVTSQPIHPSVIDYYLQLLPGHSFFPCPRSTAAAVHLRLVLQLPQPKSSRSTTLDRTDSPGSAARSGVHDLLQLY